MEQSMISYHHLINFKFLIRFHRDARIVFKAGKNNDGYFDADDLLTQVDRAINIFEDRTNGLQQACSCLIMLQVIKSEPLMHFLHTRCPKIQIADGLIIKAALTCDQLHLLMDKFKNFTFQMTIHNIQDISKGWSK